MTPADDVEHIHTARCVVTGASIIGTKARDGVDVIFFKLFVVLSSLCLCDRNVMCVVLGFFFQTLMLFCVFCCSCKCYPLLGIRTLSCVLFIVYGNSMSIVALPV